MMYVRSVGEEAAFSSRARPKFWARAAALTYASALGRIARIRGSTAEPRAGERLHAQAGGDERDSESPRRTVAAETGPFGRMERCR